MRRCFSGVPVCAHWVCTVTALLACQFVFRMQADVTRALLSASTALCGRCRSTRWKISWDAAKCFHAVALGNRLKSCKQAPEAVLAGLFVTARLLTSFGKLIFEIDLAMCARPRVVIGVSPAGSSILLYSAQLMEIFFDDPEHSLPAAAAQGRSADCAMNDLWAQPCKVLVIFVPCTCQDSAGSKTPRLDLAYLPVPPP